MTDNDPTPRGFAKMELGLAQPGNYVNGVDMRNEIRQAGVERLIISQMPGGGNDGFHMVPEAVIRPPVQTDFAQLTAYRDADGNAIFGADF